MLNYIVWNRTVYMYKNGFGIKYRTMVDMPNKQKNGYLIPNQSIRGGDI